MKRLFSVFLAIVILFSAFPLHTLAVEGSSDERDELLALACEIFPEYATKIRNNNLTTYAMEPSPQTPELVYSETRAVSTGELITYSEYSNGLILLAGVTDFDKRIEYIDSISGLNATVITANITAITNYCDAYFRLNNFKYTLISSSPDQINSIGSVYLHSPNESSRCYVTHAYDPIMQENTAPAKLEYDLEFHYSPRAGDFVTSKLTIKVGANRLTVTHNRYP